MLPISISIWLLWGIIQGTCVGLCGAGLLYLGERCDPALRSRLAFVSLLLMGCLPGLLLLPVPAWTPMIDESSSHPAPTTQESATVAGNQSSIGLTSDNPLAQPQSSISVGSLERMFTRASSAFVVESPMSFQTNTYFRWLASGLLLCIVWGVLRLAIGWWQISRLTYQAAELVDSQFARIIERLSQETNYRSTIRWRESQQLTTPVVLGWMRPTIILPMDWKLWSEAELRAALMHELAHLLRCDTLTNSLAQMILAANYFSPLAHWLVFTLRLNQELAADACAARLTGSSETYRQHLAELALRQRPHCVSSALAFLPSTTTLIRRLEMLRRAPNPSWWSQCYLAVLAPGILCLVATMVCTMRPVDAQQTATATQETAPTASGSALPDLLSYTADQTTSLIVEFDLRQLASQPKLKELLSEIPVSKRGLPVPFDDVERVLVCIPPPGSSQKPVGFLRLLPNASVPSEAALPMVDQRTLVLGNSDLREFQLAAKGKQTSQLSQLIQRHPDQAVRIAWKSGPFQQINIPVQFLPLSPLLRSTESGSLAVTINDSLQLNVILDSGNPQKIVETLRAVVTLARNGLEGLDNSPAGIPLVIFAKEFEPLLPKLHELLSSAAINASDSQVTLTASATDAEAFATEILQPAARTARIVSEREQAQEHMKQISLALHKYHDDHGHFPPSVIKENGVERSWRVEILPYLEQRALYEAYRKDEPWDSPANLLIANTIVPIYQPMGDASTNKTAYRAIGGKSGVLSSGTNGTAVSKQDITDGIASTIAFVEVPYYVPWSSPDAFTPKPEELVSATKRTNGFLAAIADGSVVFISANVDLKVLAGLLTRDGGEAPLPQPR